MPTTPPLLEYAQRQRGLRRRRVRRAIVLALVGVLCAVGYHSRKPVQDKATMLYWQRECMRYSAPPALPVLLEDGALGAEHVFADPRYVVYPSYVGIPRFAAMTPPPSEHLPFLRRTPAIAFLHRRENGRGVSRLVLLELDELPGGDGRHTLMLLGKTVDVGTFWTNLRPGNPSAPAAARDGTKNGGLLVELAQSDRATVFAGQPDGAESSRFSVRLMINQEPRFIDGQLGSDGDVLLTPRGGHTSWVSGVCCWSPLAVIPDPPSPSH